MKHPPIIVSEGVTKKRCPACMNFLVLDKFVPKKTGRFGKGTYCKKCMADRYSYHNTRPESRFSYIMSKNRKFGNLALTLEQYKSLLSKKCEYCNGDLPRTGTGLDRLDNSKGYSYENVVQCCWTCNVVRGSKFTPEEMKAFIGPAVRSVRLLRKSGLRPATSRSIGYRLA